MQSDLRRRVLRDPVAFLAFGLGSGFSPVAPGTFGSLLGVLLAWATATLSMEIRAAIALLLVVAGVWICGAAAHRVKVHDHPGIVWDEIAAIYALLLIPSQSLSLYALGFVLFRLFDINKPWPIRDLDHRLGGGLGIMLDDLTAALYAAPILALGEWYMR